MTAPAAAERALCATRLFRPARSAYQHAFNRDYVLFRKAGGEFYATHFARRGDLVFDIGANRGRMTEMLLGFGARVVAVEPLPEFAAMVHRRYRRRRLTVEQAAVGAHPGEAPMYVGADDQHSSLSSEWVQRVRSHDSLPDRWTGEITVPVITLDELITRHGEPAFVKIDVEGFEDQVLAGLTRPVAALSFEYQCPALDMTQRCLDRLGEIGAYEYRVADGEQLAFNPGGWLPAPAVMERLEALRTREPVTHGDVYARRRH